MKLTKKEKIIIICSLTVICFSLYTFNKRDILIERLANNQLLSKSYQESRGKRFEKDQSFRSCWDTAAMTGIIRSGQMN